jgi:hypothetical protein
MSSDRKYWFPAKRYGWGWGLPSAWQGWIVLVAFLALVVIGSVMLPPGKHLAAYLAYVVMLCALLIGVCWLTGEPPRWRWGDDERT